ncbi:hypothetical protein L6164_003695 [Bauhinia variegata]|uniref:Uncharacterized protein n=1 Tax=Bauhinia variegata TaxID=167791 RepID=A0ACB9Q245_BAUVA|nr:hypothetical protein L6164_003695 [Bauhinia variegata]
METGVGAVAEIVKNRVASAAQRLRRPKPTDVMSRLTGEIQQWRVQLEEAEKRQVNDGEVKKWLGTAKDVYYEMIDVLEEWRIVEMESRVHHFGLSLCFLSQLRKCLCYRDFGGKIESFISQMQEVRGAGEGLNSIEVGTEEGDYAWLNRRVFSKAVLKSRVYGRDDEAEILKRKLLSPQQDIQYLSLVGKAGIGKTTLAQTVYRKQDVQDHFQLKVWINVSHEFNLFRIARIIIQSVPETATLSIPIDEGDVQVLMLRVGQIIYKKRFLFVLDGVRNEDDSLWHELRATCKNGEAGSTILITTREDNVAHDAGCKPQQVMRVGRLSDEDCWLIIRDYALDSSTDELEGVRPYVKVGREIAKKCEGLPVVAKSLAGILSSRRSVQEWLEVLQIDIWQTSSNHDRPSNVTPSLMLSYYFLPNALRKCLLYCAIFPKDHIIYVDKLIKLWIGHGYFDSHPVEMELETVAEICFQELLNRSFFHELKKDDKGNLTCELVGAISDFIQFLAENECLILHADDKTEFADSPLEKHRHMTIKVASQASLPGDIGDTRKLHTLMVLAEYSYTDPSTLSNLLSHCRRLRALDLSSCSIRELRIKVGSLLHLRYLDLSFNRDLKKLPKEICDLSFLQTLNLNGCDSLLKLPKGIGKLSNLRHLEILWTKSLSYLPKGIASLTSLRTLNRFFGNDGVDSKECNFGDLSRLNHLQGCISIDGLGEATDVAQAREACLREKKKIIGLELWFSAVGHEGAKDGNVLEALEPPPELECLGIHYCRARSFPNWITTLEHLRELMLSDCSNCVTLPALGKLKHLEALEIRKMTELQKLGAEFLGIESEKDVSFPELKKLHFHMLTSWEKWEDIPEEGRRLSIMPQLSSVSITSCTKIEALPNYIQNKIKGIPVTVEDCPFLKEDGLQKRGQSHLATNSGAALPTLMDKEAK